MITVMPGPALIWETIMSYRSPLGDAWPNSLTDNDWNALEGHWGKQVYLSYPDESVDTSAPTRDH